jgi:peptidoglycan glycosyltransferase
VLRGEVWRLVTYVFILYVATSKPLYLFSGLLAGSGAAYVAYQLFYHVRVRVMAWQNPFAYIDKEGFQVAQSLFAIGTGGWFGMGLNRGLPTEIPVVENDFIFSAISEELGGLFAICIILIYVSCFVMFINIAVEQEEAFYKLAASGFAVLFIFQIFLSIGGVIKFIPSTGVTLPLISQGGSSVFATVLIFMILQGIYIRNKYQKKETQGSAETPEVEEKV